MTLQDWTAIGQLVLTAITFVGIVASIYLSVRALREVQEDRRQRQRPHLAFETGGYRVPVDFVRAGSAIPGVAPAYAQRLLGTLPRDAESVRMRDRRKEDGSVVLVRLGHLKNFGLGPALETSVTWIAQEVTIGSEQFHLDSDKLREARYSPGLNRMPAWKQHILPGEASYLTRLPTFIEKDTDKKISEVRGVLEIECQDVFGLRHVAKQPFYVSTGYREEQPYVHVTFMGLGERADDSA